MGINTRSILGPIELEDGRLFSIMSRHTLSDGTTSDERITKESYDEWRNEFAPPDKIIGNYYSKKRGGDWLKFKQQYLDYLRTPKMVEKVKDLAKRGLEEAITLLCIEDEPMKCHRRLLVSECKRYEPKLKVYVK